MVGPKSKIIPIAKFPDLWYFATQQMSPVKNRLPGHDTSLYSYQFLGNSPRSPAGGLHGCLRQRASSLLMLYVEHIHQYTHTHLPTEYSLPINCYVLYSEKLNNSYMHLDLSPVVVACQLHEKALKAELYNRMSLCQQKSKIVFIHNTQFWDGAIRGQPLF